MLEKLIKSIFAFKNIDVSLDKILDQFRKIDKDQSIVNSQLKSSEDNQVELASAIEQQAQKMTQLKKDFQKDISKSQLSFQEYINRLKDEHNREISILKERLLKENDTFIYDYKYEIKEIKRSLDKLRDDMTKDSKDSTAERHKIDKSVISNSNSIKILESQTKTLKDSIDNLTVKCDRSS